MLAVRSRAGYDFAMLRRLVRTLGTLGALWTLTVLGAPSLLPACGMHRSGHASGHASGDASGHVAAAAPSHNGGHGAHAMHEAAATNVPTEAPAESCQCLDCCCASAPLAFAIRAPMRLREIITPSHAGWWATSEPAPPRALALRLPFSNGPPAQHG